ncbi:ATP-binding protein [Leptospira sp. 96542]|nr:ATP-binding protein [Leptospira sp. 96542]
MIKVLGLVLSAFPYGEYIVLDEDLNIKLTMGNHLNEIFGDNENANITLEEMLKSPMLRDFNLDLEVFSKAKQGINYQNELYTDNHLHCVKIFSIPKSASWDGMNQNPQDILILFSWIRYLNSNTPSDELSSGNDTYSRVIEYEENLFREMKNIFNWRKEMENRGKRKSWMIQTLPHLNTSLMQGNGLGGLMTSLGALIRKSEKKENYAIVPIRHLDLVEENYKTTKKIVNSLATVQRYIENPLIEYERYSLNFLIQKVENLASDLEEMLKIKNQNITVSVLKNANHFAISINIDRFVTIIKELFINAMKYSPEGVSIIVLFLVSNKRFLIKIINPTEEKGFQSMDFNLGEDLSLYQPFFRMNRTVDERYDSEEFGLGLGLTIIKKIVEDMHGQIHIGTIQSGIYRNVLRLEQVDHNFSEVCVTLEFPLVD